MRVTPSLPQRGRQHVGSIPLTPPIPLSRLSREILVNLQRAIAFFMNASAGAKAKVVQPKRASEQFSHDFLQSHYPAVFMNRGVLAGYRGDQHP